MNADEAEKIVREQTIFRLAGTDGCLCMACAVQGVNIDVACRKSSGGLPYDPDFFGIVLRVTSSHLDASLPELSKVATAVYQQLHPEGYEIETRYCDYEADREQRCVWCGKPRTDLRGYVCEPCKAKPEVIERGFTLAR